MCIKCAGNQIPRCAGCASQYEFSTDEAVCKRCKQGFCGSECCNTPHAACEGCAVETCWRTAEKECRLCHIWLCRQHDAEHYPHYCEFGEEIDDSVHYHHHNRDRVKRQRVDPHPKCRVAYCFRRACECFGSAREDLTRVMCEGPLCKRHLQNDTLFEERCYGCNKRYSRLGHGDGRLTFSQIRIPTRVMIPAIVCVCSTCFSRTKEAIHALLLKGMPRHVVEDIAVMALRSALHENMERWAPLKQIVLGGVGRGYRIGERERLKAEGVI